MFATGSFVSELNHHSIALLISDLGWEALSSMGRREARHRPLYFNLRRLRWFETWNSSIIF